MTKQRDLFPPMPPGGLFRPEVFKAAFGTELHKLVRRADPDTSHAAAEKVDTSRLEQSVLEIIRFFGSKGCISDDVRFALSHYPYSSVTARYKALMDKGYIVDTGERRPGDSGRKQRVMRAV